MDTDTAGMGDLLLRSLLGAENRVDALRRDDLLDDPPRAAFDRLARLATTTLRAPVALVSLVDADRQVFAGCVGLPEPWASARQTPLSHSFCQHVVAAQAPLIVADAREHPTLRANQAIPDLGVVAYAGLPLVTPEGVVLGSFCVIDHEPRAWTDAEIATLRDLAASAMSEIELHATARRALRAATRLARLQEVTAALAGTRSAAAVADVVLRQGLAALDAQAGSLALLTPGGVALEIIAAVGYAPEAVHAYRQFPLEAPLPLADAVRTGAPILLPSAAAWAARYPGVEEHTATGNAAAAAVPLRVDERVLGGLGLSFAAARPFSAEDRSFLVALAGQCAQALERTRLDEAERAARAAERASEERFQATFEQAPVGIAHLAPDGRWLRVNRALCAILGADEAALRAGGWSDLAHPDDRPALRRAVARLLAGEVDRVALEARFGRPDGATLWGALTVSTVRDAAGTPRYHIAILEDITTRKEWERTREEFLSSAAHDLKTPLTSMAGYAQLGRQRLARSADPDAARVAGHLAHIEGGIARQLRLITELEDVTRVEMGGALDLARRPTDLVALVRGVAAQQEATAVGRIVVDAAVPTLEGAVDAARLERAVANLLANAVKYSPTGGAIVVRVAREETPEGAAAMIAVSDRGVGIPAADLPHIFERFRRAANVVGRIQGTGIGLASARQIVAQHGGAISVESTPGVGSTFTVRLPLGGQRGQEGRAGSDRGAP